MGIASKGSDSVYMPEIDGLRAFAVLAVITYHFFKSVLPSGFLGVDVFFVISGYVITKSLRSGTDASFCDFLLLFFSRRAKRLVPAAVFCVGISAVAVLLLCFSPGDYLKTAISGLFGFANIYLWVRSKDYFSSSSEINPFTHMWSLGVEEQFYLLFPLLVWLFRKKGLFQALVGVSLVSFAFFVLSENRNFVFFMMPSRLWELSLGALITFSRVVIKSRVLNSFLLAGIILSFVTPEGFFKFSSPFVCVCTAALLLFLNDGADPVMRFLKSRLLVYVGLISYSLYLWHWPVLAIQRNLFPDNGYTALFDLCLFIPLSIFSYHFIEQPIRHRKFVSANWTIIGAWLTVGVVSIFLILANKFGRQHLFLGDDNRTQLVNARARSEFSAQCHDTDGRMFECLDSPADRHRFFVIGNSHAQGYVSGLREFVGRDKYYFRTYTFNIGEKLDGLAGELVKFFSAEVRSGDIVLWSTSRLKESELRSVDSYLARLVTILENAGGKLVLVRDLPKPCQASFSNHEEYELWAGAFIFGRQSSYCQVSVENSLASRASLDRVFDRYTSRPVVISIDPHKWFCPNTVCENMVEGKLVFWIVPRI